MRALLADDPTSIAFLLAAKARVPRLPVAHVPRPQRVAALCEAVTGHQLVVLAAGALSGKTTLLVELVRLGSYRYCFWYTVDELDEMGRNLLEGLAVAVCGAMPYGDDVQVLAAIVAALSATEAPALLVLDDVHRSSIVTRTVERLLRYLPPHVHLLLSGRPTGERSTAFRRLLEDLGQVAVFGTADLRLDAADRQRFAAATGKTGAWPVHYRPGGHEAVVDSLLDGVLPALPADLRAVLDVLAVVPAATTPLVAAALGLPDQEVARRLDALERDTIVLERGDAGTCRLMETAQQAVQTALDVRALAMLRQQLANALESVDPCEAARLFALGGAPDRAISAARRSGLATWQHRQATATSLEALLPAALLRHAAPLALALANRRLIREGALAVHAFIRAIRPGTVIERIDRFRLLGQCAHARSRSWSLQQTIVGVRRLADSADPEITLDTRGYALATLGMLLCLVGDYQAACQAQEHCLELLAMVHERAPFTEDIRLLATHVLAVAQRRLGHIEDAERHYATALALAHASGKIESLLELSNNRAVLLQQLGRHHESEVALREALSVPWAADLGFRPLLLASLADALAAQGRRLEAIQALRTTLDEAPPGEPYRIVPHAHATLALLLAAGGQVAAAGAELRMAPASHPAALLAQAVLAGSTAEAGALLEAAIAAAHGDVPLHIQGRAYQARHIAALGNHRLATMLASDLIQDPRYPLTPREALILGDLDGSGAWRQGGQDQEQAASPHVVLRFFGGPLAFVDGAALGKEGWRYSNARDLLWYALAHGARGFTRDQACADLFPDLNASQAGRAFRNVIYSLRQLLRRRCRMAAPLAATAGRMQLLPSDLSMTYESDLEQLSQILARLRDGDLESATQLQGLLQLPFLADLHGDWLRPFRAYWDSEAVRALDLAATLAERACRLPEALEYLRREAEFCPDDPLLTRRIMALGHVLGDDGVVRATYLQHCRAAREELGVDPDAGVAALYAELSHH